MTVPIRKTVRVLLINDQKELLLICAEDFDVQTKEGHSIKRFWFTVGGGLEDDESMEQAALREIHEETGISRENVSLGPIVWYGEVELVLKGKLTRLKEFYICATTKQKEVALHRPTDDEKNAIKLLRWFSLKDIKQSKETIFPIILSKYLPDILAGNYPEQPIEVNLS